MYKKLALSIVLDIVGCLSFFIPFFDFVWAPISAYIMTKMYDGKIGKIAAVVGFVEEILPWFDIIPTFTIMWFYAQTLERKK